MFYRINDSWKRLKFSWYTRRILETAPVTEKTNRPVAVLTQLQHKDVMLFLAALKSFAYHIPLKKVFILNDGTLVEKDIELLQEHIPIASFYDIREFEHPLCPNGGTWERLLGIARFVQEFYIVQLDSDTLAISQLKEVEEHIGSETAFVIGTWDGQEIEPMKKCSARTGQRTRLERDSHVQTAAEIHFSQIAGSDEMKYVRGCSGFAGFPRESFDIEFVVEFSRKMEEELGRKWREWGSEQVMSNVVVANIPGAKVLPHPQYCTCRQMKDRITRFIHFIGNCRFEKGVYGKLARDVAISIIESQSKQRET